MTEHSTPRLENRLATPRPVSYSDQVYGRILSDIVSGDLTEDGRLPPENELCQRFGVSRPVVRKALSRLRLDGLVETRRGSGTYVVNRPSEKLRPADLTAISKVLRYLELRLLVEGQAAAYAAQRRSSDALALIVRSHTRFVDQISAGSFRPTGDRDFHMAIAMATGNEFFVSTLDHAKAELSDFQTITLSLTKAGSPERARSVMQEHANIVESIRAQDPVGAKIAMEFHILQAKRRLTDRSYEP